MSPIPRDQALKIVQSGYDKIARLYIKEREQIDIQSEVDAFCSSLPKKSRVLDVGCGTGLPIARQLKACGFKVVGIDLSEEMITVAKQNVPGVEFLQMNMAQLTFPPASFDGLIACYSLFHLPRNQHAAIFQSFHKVLKPNGIMLVSVGASDWEEVEDYFGVDMFWSHFDPKISQSLITEAGFDIEFGREVKDGGEVHHWVLARKR